MSMLILMYDNCQPHADKLYEARDRGTAPNLKTAQVMELKEVIGAVRSSFNDGRISSVLEEINSLAP